MQTYTGLEQLSIAISVIVDELRSLNSNAAQCCRDLCLLFVQSGVFAMRTVDFMLFIHIVHRFSSPLRSNASRVTAPIFPACSPPLLPPCAIESVFAQLLIHRIVRFTHPRAKFAPARHPRRIPAHPGLEIFCAHPARIQLAKRGEKRLGI
jgi:hypothetical protein